MILTDSSSLEWPFPHVLVVYQLIVHWQWSIDIPWYPVIYPELHYSIIRWIQLSNVPPPWFIRNYMGWYNVIPYIYIYTVYTVYIYIYVYMYISIDVYYPFTIQYLLYIYIHLIIYIYIPYNLYIYYIYNTSTSFIYIYIYIHYPLLSNTVCWGTLGNSPPASRLMILISSLRRWASRLLTVVEQTEWYPMGHGFHSYVK